MKYHFDFMFEKTEVLSSCIPRSFIFQQYFVFAYHIFNLNIDVEINYSCKLFF